MTGADPRTHRYRFLRKRVSDLASVDSKSELTDGNGKKTKWHNDIQGRLTSKVYADNSTVNYSYEPVGGWFQSRTDDICQETRMSPGLS